MPEDAPEEALKPFTELMEKWRIGHDETARLSMELIKKAQELDQARRREAHGVRNVVNACVHVCECIAQPSGNGSEEAP